MNKRTEKNNKFNPLDCKNDKYVGCQQKFVQFREICTKTYQTQCSEIPTCNAGDKVVATKPC